VLDSLVVVPPEPELLPVPDPPELFVVDEPAVLLVAAIPPLLPQPASHPTMPAESTDSAPIPNRSETLMLKLQHAARLCATPKDPHAGDFSMNQG